MIRIFILLGFLWFCSVVANMFFVGALVAREGVREETKQRWFLWALLGGPFFTAFAALMWLLNYSELRCEEKGKKETAERNKRVLGDIFKDAD